MCAHDPFAEALQRVQEARSGLREEHHDVVLHEVDGALVAIGRVPFEAMMKAVSDHEGISYHPENFEMLQSVVYRSVLVDLTDGIKIEWDRGLTPVTAYNAPI